uniref:Transmembrane protein n=1 Tax=Heterorhabditis bacteriophora TaxID=37862 RepID=A0A1I7WR46_HETBA
MCYIITTRRVWDFDVDSLMIQTVPPQSRKKLNYYLFRDEMIDSERNVWWNILHYLRLLLLSSLVSSNPIDNGLVDSELIHVTLTITLSFNLCDIMLINSENSHSNLVGVGDSTNQLFFWSNKYWPSSAICFGTMKFRNQPNCCETPMLWCTRLGSQIWLMYTSCIRLMALLVIQFVFLRFMTKVDQTVKIQCFYMEADKPVTVPLSVSMITTQFREKVYQMPQCSYTLRKGGPEGDIVRYATLGESVYHRWECVEVEKKTLLVCWSTPAM